MEPVVTEHDQLLDKVEAAALCRVSRRTIDRWIELGIGPPPLKLGPAGLVRFRLGDIRDWLRECQRPA